MLDLERQSALRSQCSEVCQSVVVGKIGLVEGIRSLVSLSFELECEDEEPFLSFRGIDSQSDHFPLGECRNLWDNEALAREDASRVMFERDFMEKVVADCNEIIQRFERAEGQKTPDS